jgi:glycosyltransferase involved in cell wall biosynthesis
VAVSRASAQAFASGGWTPRVVHGAVELRPETARPTATDGRPVVVGTIGAVSRIKGSDTFIEAAAALRKRFGERVETRLVGDFTYALDADWGRALVRRAKSEGVLHLPWVETFKELAGWDIFVAPSRSDAFPIVVLEAMAAGLPVVATRVGGLPEQVAPGTGLLVPPDDPGALADAVATLVERAELRAELGEAGRRSVQARFGPEQQAQGLHEAYLDAISRRTA